MPHKIGERPEYTDELQSAKELRASSAILTPAEDASLAMKRIDTSYTEQLVQIGKKMNRLGDQHHKTVHHALVETYKIACLLREDSDKWLDFCRSYPQNSRRAPSYGDRTDALQRAMRRMIGFSEDPKENTVRSKKASLYTKALVGAFYLRLDSKTVMSHLTDNGVTGLVAKAREKPLAKANPQPKLSLANSPASRLLARRKFKSGAHIEATVTPLGNGKTILTILNAGPIQLPVPFSPKRPL